MPARSAHRVALLAALTASSLLTVAAPSPASAAVRSFEPQRVTAGVATFKMGAVAPASISSASVRVGAKRAPVALGQVRAGAKRGQLRVRLPRTAVQAASRKQTRLVVTTKRGTTTVTAPTASAPGTTVATRPTTPTATKPSVTTTAPSSGAQTPAVDPSIGPATQPSSSASGPVANFEGGNFSELDDQFSSWEGSLSVTSQRAYQGNRSAQATFNGNGTSGAARVWRPVDWKNGSDVWYGMAMYVPDTSAYCYWNPMRWDNYKTYGGEGDVGGVAIEDGKVKMIQNYYGRSERQLTPGVAIPQGRWFWLEVHQRFSENDGQALSELYMDGKRIGASRAANSAGRAINNVRFGVVNVAGSCSRPGTVNFDRVSISDAQRGPVNAG